MDFLSNVPTPGLACVLACLSFGSMPAQACTIFVVSDTNRALFCTNEDWSNPKTRIWFLPAGDSRARVVSFVRAELKALPCQEDSSSPTNGIRSD
jgi:hypothetical protein